MQPVQSPRREEAAALMRSREISWGRNECAPGPGRSRKGIKRKRRLKGNLVRRLRTRLPREGPSTSVLLSEMVASRSMYCVRASSTARTNATRKTKRRARAPSMKRSGWVERMGYVSLGFSVRVRETVSKKERDIQEVASKVGEVSNAAVSSRSISLVHISLSKGAPVCIKSSNTCDVISLAARVCIDKGIFSRFS